MPTVPSTFVPQVGLSDINQVPMQAPGVQPMENFAPRQQIEMGRAMQAVGLTEFKIGSALQDALDDATAKEADTAFLNAANEIVRGRQGYLRTDGKNADLAYAPVSDALSQAAQNAMDNLQNDTQRRMFAPVLARNMMTYKNQIEDHRDTEVKRYAINESKARASQYVQLAINATDTRNEINDKGEPTGPFNVNLGVALSEIRNVGKSLGIADGSAQMRDLERMVFTQTARGVTNRLMLEKDYQGALDYVTDQNKKGNLEEDAVESMMSSIWANRERQMVDELATQIKETGIPESPSAFGYLLPLDNATDVKQFDDDTKRVAIQGKVETDLKGNTAAFLQVPQTGTIEDVQRDENGRYTVTMVTNDGTVLSFGNLPAQRLPDKGAVMQRGLAFAKTDDTGVFWYGAARNGRAVDPMNVNVYGEPDRSAVERPKTLSEAIKATQSIPDAETRRNVQQRLRSMYEQDNALARQEYATNVNGIEEFLATPGNSLSMIPPDKWGQLTESDRQRLMGEQRKTNELDMMEMLARDPGVLTPEWLLENRNSFTRETYIKLLKDAQRPDKVYEAKIEADQMNLVLLENQFGALVNPKSDEDKLKSLRLREAVTEQIDRIQKQQQKPVTDQQRRQIIEDRLLDIATVDVNWRIDRPMPISMMSPEEVLSSYRDVNGRREPLISDRTRSKIEKALIEANPTVTLTPALIVRTWNIMRQEGSIK